MLMRKAGMVVQSMERMWSTTSTSATAAASTVVSETGLSLSPK